MDSIEMRTDAELLNTLLDEVPVFVDLVDGRTKCLSAKLIAHFTGRAVQTVSDYRTGKINIPAEFWRGILAHYQDARIISLIVPDGWSMELVPVGGNQIETGAAWFEQALRDEEARHRQLMHLAEIIRDGRVDETDGASVQAFDDAYLEHRQRDAILHRSIMDRYQRATATLGAAS